MASINKVFIVGNLGKDPETRYLDNGDAVCNFSVAVTESWKDKTTGEKKEQTEWVRVVAFRKLAEVCGQYLKKGSQVFVEGKMKTRKYQKDGADHYTTEVHIHEMQMLGARGPQAENQDAEPPRPKAKEKPKADFSDLDDDVPF